MVTSYKVTRNSAKTRVLITKRQWDGIDHTDYTDVVALTWKEATSMANDLEAEALIVKDCMRGASIKKLQELKDQSKSLQREIDSLEREINRG